MTKYLAKLAESERDRAVMAGAAGRKHTANKARELFAALTALIEAREKLVRMEGQMHEVEAGDMSTYEVIDEIDAAIAAIDALSEGEAG